MIDSCKQDVRDITALKGDIDSIEKLKLSKESLHTIALKLKKSIKANDIDTIKSKDLKIITDHQEQLEKLSNSFKLKNKNKKELKNFIKETCKIDNTGHVFKVLMRLK